MNVLGFSSLTTLLLLSKNTSVCCVLFIERFGTQWAFQFSQVYVCQHIVTRSIIIVTLNV